MSAKPQINKLMTGLAGEYAVAASMNLKGWIASLTLKNYPSVDIFGFNPQYNLTAHIQVKTNKTEHFFTGIRHSDLEHLESIIKGPFVFVHAKDDSLDSMSFYILSRSEIISLIRESDNSYFCDPHKRTIKDNYTILLYLKRDKLIDYKDCWDSLWKD